MGKTAMETDKVAEILWIYQPMVWLFTPATINNLVRQNKLKHFVLVLMQDLTIMKITYTRALILHVELQNQQCKGNICTGTVCNQK